MSDVSNIDFSKLSVQKKRELLLILEAIQDKRDHNKIKQFYPDTGPLRRELYVKHLEFFEAGKHFTERLAMFGNRTGKTIAGAFETNAHLTGRYPNWWPGRVFDNPVEWWASGKTAETTRDIVQKALLGKYNDLGSGMIPRDAIVGKPRPKSGGVPNSIDLIEIDWGGGGDVSGGNSLLGFKNYAQGRGAFEGTFKNGVWFDEESEKEVYDEALMRITSTDGSGKSGLLFTTFTPLKGMSQVVMSFLPTEYSFKDTGRLSPEADAIVRSNA